MRIRQSFLAIGYELQPQCHSQGPPLLQSSMHLNRSTRAISITVLPLSRYNNRLLVQQFSLPTILSPKLLIIETSKFTASESSLQLLSYCRRDESSPTLRTSTKQIMFQPSNSHPCSHLSLPDPVSTATSTSNKEPESSISIHTRPTKKDVDSHAILSHSPPHFDLRAGRCSIRHRFQPKPSLEDGLLRS